MVACFWPVHAPLFLAPIWCCYVYFHCQHPISPCDTRPLAFLCVPLWTCTSITINRLQVIPHHITRTLLWSTMALHLLHLQLIESMCGTQIFARYTAQHIASSFRSHVHFLHCMDISYTPWKTFSYLSYPSTACMFDIRAKSICCLIRVLHNSWYRAIDIHVNPPCIVEGSSLSVLFHVTSRTSMDSSHNKKDKNGEVEQWLHSITVTNSCDYRFLC